MTKGFLKSHSFKCLLNACIDFNNALFHIFSGPLFANVEGYVYFDLIIWGLSPLIFLLLRQKIVELMKANKNIMKVYNLKAMILFCLLTIISFMFMNYSHTFNWNYFSRSFNLDFGYFIFDFLMRTFSLIIEVEENEEDELQCEGYCELRHSALTFVYIVVFYLSSTFDLNERDNGPKIFAISCCFSCFFTFCVPFIYFLKNKQWIQNANYVSVSEEDNLKSSQIIGLQFEPTNTELQPWDRKVVAFIFINSSLLININYYSLWMMQPLGTDSESSFQQYNVTIEMVSGFFMLSSFSYFLSFRLYNNGFNWANKISQPLMIIYGFLLMYVYWVYEVNYVCMILLGFGFQQICCLYYGLKLEHSNKINHKLYLYNQVLVYFILPLIYTPLQIGTKSLSSYAFTSGAALAIGGILM